MGRIATLVAVALSLLGAALVASTSGALPPRVASHFGAGGAANGWMTREGYTWFMMLLTAVLPLVLLGSLAWLPARFERWVNLPHRDYWMASPQRAATIESLRTFGAIMGGATALFMMALHALILDANAATPPRLDEGLFFVCLAAFIVAIVGCTIALTVRFRKVPQVR